MMLSGCAFFKCRSRPTKLEMYGVILFEGWSERSFFDQSVSVAATHCHWRPTSFPPLLKRRKLRAGAAKPFASTTRRRDEETKDPGLRERSRWTVGTNACVAAAKHEIPTRANVGYFIMGAGLLSCQLGFLAPGRPRPESSQPGNLERYGPWASRPMGPGAITMSPSPDPDESARTVHWHSAVTSGVDGRGPGGHGPGHRR